MQGWIRKRTDVGSRVRIRWAAVLEWQPGQHQALPLPGRRARLQHCWLSAVQLLPCSCGAAFQVSLTRRCGQTPDPLGLQQPRAAAIVGPGQNHVEQASVDWQGGAGGGGTSAAASELMCLCCPATAAPLAPAARISCHQANPAAQHSSKARKGRPLPCPALRSVWRPGPAACSLHIRAEMQPASPLRRKPGLQRQRGAAAAAWPSRPVLAVGRQGFRCVVTGRLPYKSFETRRAQKRNRV